MKSRTYPNANLSIKLPSPPEKMRSIEYLKIFGVFGRTTKNTSTKAIPIPVIAESSVVLPLKMPKNAP